MVEKPQQEWLKQFAVRVWNLAQQKEPIQVRENDQVIFEFDMGKLLTVGKGQTTIELGGLGLKTKGSLVGMGGVYYHPNVFWGETAEKVVRSWEWLIERMSVDPQHFQAIIEAEAIIEFLVKGWEEGLLFHLLSLAVDLKELNSLGIKVTPKTEELGKKARDHLKKAKRLELDNIAASLFRIGLLRSYMAELSSECRLARLAMQYGCKVRLGKHPDLTINGRAVEVKRMHAKFPVRRPRPQFPLGDLSNPIRKGLKQNADIVAIQVLNLSKREIKGIKTVWMGKDILRNALKAALRFQKNGRCVLLFLGTNRGYFGRIILVK